MNRDRIEGSWKQFKGIAQQRWSRLAGKFQESWGVAKDKLRREPDRSR